METQTTLANGVSTVGEKAKDLVLNVTKLPTMEELERQYLTLVLEQSGGNKVKAAKILGFSVKTIYNKLAEYKTNETLRNNP